MKKILLILLVLFNVYTVSFAEDSAGYRMFHYGGFVVNPITLEGTQGNNYTFHNSGGYTHAITSEEKHTGQSSFRINCASSTGQCLLETTNLINVADMSKNSLLLELYVKGFETKPNTVGFYAIFLNQEGNVISAPEGFGLTMETADVNGWHRVWGMVPPYNYSKIRFGVSYNKASADGMQYLYIDDISARFMPVDIRIEPVACQGGSVNLRDIRVKGYNNDGYVCDVYAVDLIKYTVTQGSAVIDGNLLLYTGEERGSVSLNADFFDKNSSFEVWFDKKETTVSQVLQENNVYTVTIDNPTEQTVNAALFICIFDGERLSDVRIFQKPIASDTIDSISAESPEIPFYVKEPYIRAYATWTN